MMPTEIKTALKVFLLCAAVGVYGFMIHKLMDDGRPWWMVATFIVLAMTTAACAASQVIPATSVEPEPR